MNVDYRQQAKDLFNVLNTVQSNNGNEVLDKDELQQARACGLSKILFNFDSEENVSEQNFIDKYIEVAEKESENDVRKEDFQAQCQNIKTCYEDLKRYKQHGFGLENSNQQNKAQEGIEVSQNTIERVPREGMYTMIKGYKIIYTDNAYNCPQKPEWGNCKNLLELTFNINQEIKEKNLSNLTENLQNATSIEDKQKIMKDFVDNLHTWELRFSKDFCYQNSITGRQKVRMCGFDIYYNVGNDGTITFNYDAIYQQLQ